MPKHLLRSALRSILLLSLALASALPVDGQEGPPAIGDTVWCDEAPPNGTFDFGEGLSGITVTLYSDDDCNHVLGENEDLLDTQETDEGGMYLFDGDGEGLAVGTVGNPVCYIVEVDAVDPDLGACTAPFTPTLFDPDLTDAAPQSLVNDFGFVEPTGLAAFSKDFAPSTIGPGSVSRLTFTIVNSDSEPLSELAFTDNLPAGMTIATPASAATDCVNAVLGAPDGGSTVSLSGAGLAPGASCTVAVNVTAASTRENVSGGLTSSTGAFGVATATLTVDGRPGFSKSFTPSTIPLGGTSVLRLTISSGSGANTMTFTDILPDGMVFATPANAVNTCGGFLSLSIGGGGGVANDTIALTLGSVAAESTCFVEVDVTTTTTGVFVNTTGELVSIPSGSQVSVSSGFATAALDVPVQFLVKSFIDDPVPPGGTVTLQFIVTNLDRDSPATAIAFDDDLEAVLAGLAPAETLPKPACGGTVDFAADILSLSGGSLPAGESCSFTVELDVPIDADADTYTNTTEAITAVIDGEGVVGNTATDRLTVSFAPSFTKEFINDPAAAGGTVTLRFTITNTFPGSDLTDIAFSDDLDTAILGLAANSLVSGGLPDPLLDVCGVGSELTVFDPLGATPPDPTLLIFTGGSLAAAESEPCSFDIVLDVPAGIPAGVYTNTSSDVTGVIDDCGDGCTAPVTGPPASGELVVVGAPQLTKEFTDDPALPVGTVTLEFTLSHAPDAAGDATAITFADDLGATLAGLTATGATVNDCGGMATSGFPTTNFGYAGGSLTPGASCTIELTLDVPAAAAAGSHPNTTSNVVATVAGVPGVIGNPAADQLRIAGVVLSKEFTDDPVLPGGVVTLRFTLANLHPTDDATGISFSDNLGGTTGALLGLAAEAPLPDTSSCGAGSALSGTTSLEFAGGSLDAVTSCFFDVTVRVPGGAADGSYNNVTSSVTATLGDASFTGDPARDVLTVDSHLLFLTKEFLGDPVAPGGTVTLEFTLTNQAAEAVSGIAFSDDLAPVLDGLLPTGSFPMANLCGVGSELGFAEAMGPPHTAILSLTGGSLAASGAAGDACTFSLTLDVPSGATLGTAATNTTSEVTGLTSGELAVTGDPAIDELLVALGFTKAFSAPAAAGGTVTLTFNIQNPSTTAGVVDLSFSDNLGAVIPGLAPSGPLPATPCGGGSALGFAAGILTLTGGNLLPGGSCTVPVTLQLPPAAASGAYPNVTSDLFLPEGVVVAGPATADLEVIAPAIDVEKATNGVDADSVPGPSLLEGAPVSWTYAVTNTGDVALTGVAVSDDQGVTVSCPQTTLAVEESMTCTAAGTAAPGQYQNLGTATATSSPGGFAVEDSDLSHYFGIALGTIVIEKVTDPAGGTGFSFSDDIEEPGSFALDDGQSSIFTDVMPGVYTVVETVPEGWSLTDVTCDGAGERVRSAAPGAVLGLVPAGTRGAETGVTIDLAPGATVTCTFTNTAQGIEVTKTPDFPQVFAGSSATFTIAVRNTGLTELTNLVVSDPLTPACERTAGELPPLAAGGVTSYTCATDPLFADLTNVATVTADVALGPPISAEASAFVEVVDPVIEITKTPAEQQILAGETATFTITVTNLDDDGLTDLVVVDLPTPDCERGGSEGAPDLPDLPAGQSIFYECTTEPLGANLTNVATVSAVTREGQPVTASASALVTVIPPVEITKSPSEQEVLLGETATFTITLANPGAVAKTDVVVSDPLTPACDLTLPGLAAGATFSYSCATGPLSADLTNRATVTAESPAGTATATSTALVRVLEPPIGIAKELIAQVVNPGDTAPFTITVSNPGTLTLTGVAVADPATPSCAAALPDIPPGGEESYACTSSPVFADFTNVATVTATAGGTPVSASASAEVNVRQPIVITKSPAEQAVSYGEPATFTITVRNEGTDVKTGVAVSDSLTPDCDRAAGALGDLAPNAGTATYTCTTGALTADLLNEATVTATGDEGPVTDSATALVVVLTDLEITKTPELQQLEAGEAASFTIEVTNAGDQVVTGVLVSDPETPACDADLGDLDPGETLSYGCATEPLFADLTNVATVRGDVAGGEVRATATAVVEVVKPLVITKEPEQQIQAGDTAEFTITVANPSRVSRTGVAVADPLTPSCTRAAGVLGDLAPGASTSYTCTSDPLFSDLVNVATATAEGPTGTVSAFDAALVSVLAPEIGITKTPGVQLVLPGASAAFIITLTNPGPGALTGLAVSDPLTPDCSRAPGVLPDLPAGVSTSYGCTTGPLTEDFVNVATVSATSETAIAVSASASAEVNVIDPISIVKGPLDQQVLVGDAAVFTITLSNESDVLKTGVAVSDPLSPDCDRPAGTLPDLGPGGGTFAYVCTSAPVAADFVNVATVTAGSAEGLVSATASAAVQAVTLTPPAVVGLATEAGPLAACDTVRLPLRRIEVTLTGSEPPFPGAGDLASYLLVGSGADGDFATGACGGAAGDDIPIEIVSLSLTGSDPTTVTARLGLGVSLAPGLYRLLVCDTITDELGNALDGDGDGNPGGDFVLPFFRADPFNRFENGHFDDCPVTLEPWVMAATAPNVVQPGEPGVDDSEGSPLSASARALHASSGASALAQCVAVEGATSYDWRARVRFDPHLAAVARFEQACEFFAGAGCSGASLGPAAIVTLLEDEGGAWLFLSSEIAAPAGAVSALCDVVVEDVVGESFDAFLDGLFLGSGGQIFADGFESGDVSAWSSSVP